MALFALAMAAVNLLSAVRPALHDRLAIVAVYVPLEVLHGARLASALSGFALVVLSFWLWRRKRAARWLTECVLGLSAVSHMMKGLDYEEAGLSLALLPYLVTQRARFSARSDAPSVVHGVRVLLFAVLFTLVYGVVGFYVLDRQFRVDSGMGAALRQTLVMFASFSNPGLETATRFGRYFADSIYTVATVALGFGLLMLLRPVLVLHSPSPEEQARARSTMQAWGRSSLAPLALLPDKSFFCSPGGSLVSYVVHGHIALALGDPIGAPEDVPATLSAFRDFCERNDWQSAYYQALPENLDAYRQAGYNTLHIGDEAVVPLSSFTLEGGANKSIRTATSRLTREGYRAELMQTPYTAEVMGALRSVSDQWLTTVEGSEKAFCLGWFDDVYIQSGPVMAVYGPGEGVVAFANIVPEYRRDDATIDLMRRRPDTPGGLMDLLFVRLFQWAREKGCGGFNLRLSPLAGVGTAPSDPAVERSLHFIFEHLNQFYRFPGLHALKAEFLPAWSPRYLAYPRTPALPAVALAILRADSGEPLLANLLARLLPRRTRPSGTH